MMVQCHTYQLYHTITPAMCMHLFPVDMNASILARFHALVCRTLCQTMQPLGLKGLGP